MTPLGALVAVLVLGWAAFHGNDHPTPPRPPQGDCTITQHWDGPGPVDPNLAEMSRKLAEALCHGDPITENDTDPGGNVQ